MYHTIRANGGRRSVARLMADSAVYNQIYPQFATLCHMINTGRTVGAS